MSEPIMNTVAACDRCGRGYCYIANEANPPTCLDGNCRGQIRMLAATEGMKDGAWFRNRRLERMRDETGYLRELVGK